MTSPLRFYNPQVALVLNLMQQLQARERVVVDVLRASQAQELQKLFKHAWQHSTFWRERLARAGLATELNPLAVLAQLPLLRISRNVTGDYAAS